MPPAAGSLTERYQQALTLAAQGDRAGALSILAALRLARPDSPEILFQIGRLEAAGGRADAAEAALRAALALRPKEPAIWHVLHLVLTGDARRRLERDAAKARVTLGSEADCAPVYAALKAGNPDRAEALALALVKAAPEAAWPALALGEARMARGAWGGALGPLDKAVERAPDLPRARAALGETLLQLELFARAEPLLAELAEGRRPAKLPLARLLRRTLRPEDAAPLLQRAVAEAPQDRALHEELALALADLGQGEPARAAARKAATGGARLHLMRRVADGLQGAGAIAEAEATIDAALAERPRDAGLLTHRAQYRQSAGDLAGAEADLQAAIAADPDAAEAYRAYVNGRTIAAGDPVAAQIAARLARPDLPRAARRVLHFAAAKAALDRKAPDAFTHLHTANRLTAEAFPYGFDADLAEARRLVADWQTLKGWAPEGPADPVLFVTGLPRSGTTLVETILAAHPAVTAGGELPFLSRAMAPALERLRAGQGDAAGFAEAGRRYLRAARRRTGTDGIFTDKAISTFSRVGHVVTALPGARVVILRRDPRDVGLSLYRNLFPEGLHRYAYDLAAMGRYIRLHDALVAFWAQALPDRVHVIDYEALTADPGPQIRALVDFCGLPWDDACLAPERAERRVETLSFAQVRAPIGRQAVAGWRRHEAELAPLIRALEETRIDLGA
ncbi:sulfotransferase family protein [Roseicyclus persicicus]|uniref:Sulfotransferase n=1 Tax=Roseicyclus persicicus TaxID=2650661 RepID=A0A7X6JYZ6_9RHOB|nr:sulfotransferase [Roseibacterium persicicum]NKX44278.1 sulfotransferase [Roseibacterium persicicum]